jgi:hypothetical protein
MSNFEQAYQTQTLQIASESSALGETAIRPLGWPLRIRPGKIAALGFTQATSLGRRN